MPLSRLSVGTYLKTSSHATCQGTFGQSSQLAEPLWTDSGRESGISVSKLISNLKKKSQEGIEWLNVLPKSSQMRKKATAGSHIVAIKEDIQFRPVYRSIDFQVECVF